MKKIYTIIAALLPLFMLNSCYVEWNEDEDDYKGYINIDGRNYEMDYGYITRTATVDDGFGNICSEFTVALEGEHNIDVNLALNSPTNRYLQDDHYNYYYDSFVANECSSSYVAIGNEEFIDAYCTYGAIDVYYNGRYYTIDFD